MSNNLLTIAVVGGGASGLMAAIWAARTSLKLRKKTEVTIYDSNPRVGKKITVTGNGRCNLTNLNISDSDYYGCLELFNPVYSQFNNNDLINFFSDIGMNVRSDTAGRVYPLSNQATSVLDALRFEVEHLGIKIVCDTKITSIEKKQAGFVLNKHFFADRVILACGGKAGYVHGSDGSGYDLLNMLHIQYSDIFPALTALEINGFTKSLKGIRAEGRITSKFNGKALLSAEGELQYTDYGISGIPAMQISRSISELLYTGKVKDVEICVDNAPHMTTQELTDFIINAAGNNPDLPCDVLLSGIVPKKLGAYLLTKLSINPEKPVSCMHSAVIDKTVKFIKCNKYRVTGVKGYSIAQVTAGGVTSSELMPETLETKKYKGLFICGELADIDGDCGGYNLQWAFSSGYVAGINSVRE